MSKNDGLIIAGVIGASLLFSERQPLISLLGSIGEGFGSFLGSIGVGFSQINIPVIDGGAILEYKNE